MYIKLYIKVLSKQLTIINKCILLDFYVLYIPTVHAFGSLSLTLTDAHT